MKKGKLSRFISLAVVFCIIVGMLPAVVTADDSEHTYEYVGAGLSKLYDGTTVSFDPTTDIEIDGEKTFAASGLNYGWIGAAGGEPSSVAPVGNGDGDTEYALVIYGERGASGGYTYLLEKWFLIYTENHLHSYDNRDYIYDGEYHWQECLCGEESEKTAHTFAGAKDIGDGTHIKLCETCEYSVTEAHNWGEWETGTTAAIQVRSCEDCSATESRDTIYTVTYDYATNGGTSATVSEKTYEYGTDELLDLTPTATKAGYEFLGWSFEENSHDVITNSSNKVISSDITLYAVFKTERDVKFYSKDNQLQTTISATVYNNETSYIISDDYPSGLSPDSYTVGDTMLTTLGWTDSANSFYIVDLMNVDGTPAIPDIFKDYYAVYNTLNEITLSYDTRNDDYTVHSQTAMQYFNSSGKYSDAEFTLPPLAMTHLVENFVGWAVGSIYGKQYKPDDNLTISEDTTVYAVYEEDDLSTPVPTSAPTSEPTEAPTAAPTAEPAVTPTSEPTLVPTEAPTEKPSSTPTAEPKATPTVTPSPTTAVTEKPAATATAVPTATPSAKPTPTVVPTIEPTAAPVSETVTVRFYSRNGLLQSSVSVPVYNDGSMGSFTFPTPLEYGVYTALGWRSDDKAESFETRPGDAAVPEGNIDYYAVYSKDITLSYDTGNASYTVANDTKTLYFNSAGNTSETEFTFAGLSNAQGFLYWSLGGKSGDKYKAGEKITLTSNETAYAIWQLDVTDGTVKQYKVKYDYSSNGGTSISLPSTELTVSEGEKADLAVEAAKSGYELVGWNTDKNAVEALNEYVVTEDTTLYAIYKKTVKAAFHKIGSNDTTEVTGILYNNAAAVAVTAPAPDKVTGYEADGWRTDTGISAAQYKSGAVKINGDTDFYPVYKRYISLSYDTNGANDAIAVDTSIQYMNNGAAGNIEFALSQAPSRSGYSFKGWALSSDAKKLYSAKEVVSLTNSAKATAQWEKLEIQPDEFVVTYNYTANGGSGISAAAQQMTVKKGEKANLEFEAYKNGYEFIGWNTDMNAKEGIAEYTIKDNVTLYAIFAKKLTVNFYAGETGKLQESIAVTLFNNEREAQITVPTPEAIDGWTAEGWRDNKHALESEIVSGTAAISRSTDFYAIYSRDITVTESQEGGVSVSTRTLNQYRSASGATQSQTIMLPEPDAQEGYRFRGWIIDNDRTTRYKAGTLISVNDDTKIEADWVKLPEGDASLPEVETEGASLSSDNTATLSMNIENYGGDDLDILERGFVYWSKLNSGSKYTVVTDEDSYEITNLSPGTEYYYYAFAENAAGTGKGYIKSFTVASDDTPNALMISPEYVSIEIGGVYQLLATLLPVTASNRSIVWSSSDESVVTVDSEGSITGIGSGQAVITATTEVGRLTAECIVDVIAPEEEEAAERNFSEWNMTSHTSGYYNKTSGFDWDTSREGGNHIMATAYLARWDGAVLEDEDPYPAFNKGAYTDTDNMEAYHVQDVEWLPKRESYDDNDEIKSALMEYGAVYSMICIDWNYFDKSYTNYYSPKNLSTGGHAITIVGWDDNYSRDNFKVKPEGDGAFICKNSWGEDTGENGFFYVSYYDRQIGIIDSCAAVSGYEQKDASYNTIYQYDPLGAVGYLGFEDTTYAANVFPEENKTLAKDEELKAVSFYTYHKNTSYDVYIVTDYKDKSSLTKLWEPAASGEIENSGYHTINLNSPVTLEKGTRFAVVIKLDAPGEYSYVYCEYPVSGYSSNARANSGESFYSDAGRQWYVLTEDVENANFCIKAFTNNKEAGQTMLSAIDNDNREYENDSIYTLSEAVEKGMPISEDYIDYVEKINSDQKSLSLMSADEGQLSLGTMPSIIKAGSNSVTFTDGAIFPSSYDLRTMGLVSSVKNQGEWSTCWAHTMCAVLESNMLLKAKTTKADTSSNIPSEMILSREALTMTPESALTLAKKITPVSAEDKSVLWLSSDEGIATVDTNGTIRAEKSGWATVTAATVSGGICAQCSVYVENDDAETTVSFEEKRVKKAIDDIFMVAYSVTPMYSADYSFGWISDNTNVAEVNENGVITAVGEGTADISILSDTGEIMDSVTVVVGSGYNCTAEDIDTSGLVYEDGSLTGDIKVTVNNSSSGNISSMVTVAAYETDTGVLAGTVCLSALLATGDNEITLEDVQLTDIDEEKDYTIKCFVWGSFEALIPISKSNEKQI